MKLQPDKSDVQTLTAHGPGWVAINNERVESSVVVGSRGERFEWDAGDFGQLGAEHFARLASLGAELVIFGSGKRIRFPQPAWLQPLTLVNPIHHFAAIVRGSLLKGSGLATLWPNAVALLVFTLVLVSLSIWRFRKQLS